MATHINQSLRRAMPHRLSCFFEFVGQCFVCAWATISKMNPSNSSISNNKETEFPVQVYRKTEKGWQRMTARPNAAGNTSTTIAVSVRPNCLVLHRIQVRIKLNAQSTLIRRQSKLLLSNPTGLRSIVLQFESVAACQQFCDELMALHPSPTTNAERPDDSDSILTHAGLLLHDPDFCDFVNALETTLSQTTDGSKLLEALVASSSSCASG